MPNQMIALQSRGAKMPDPTAQTAKFVNMMNMAKQQEAAERQASLAQQQMANANADEARRADLHGPALKKAQLEYVGLVADQFSRDVGKLKEGDVAGAEALRANVVKEIPAWNDYIRPASEWTTEYRTQLMLKGKEIADKTIPDVVASKEYAAPGGFDAQGNPIPEDTIIDTRIGGFTGAARSTPVRDVGAATPAPRATPTTPAPQAMGTGADMRATQGSNTTPQDLIGQGMNPNNIPSGMPTSRPISFNQSDMGGAGAGQMTPEVMSRIADSAFQTGVIAQVDFDQLLATQPPENRQAFTDAFRRANITLQADAPSLADSGMGQQQMAANPVQTPQAGFADFRGPAPQSRTADLGNQPMMRNTEAQYIPVQRRDPNVSTAPAETPEQAGRRARLARETPEEVYAKEKARAKAAKEALIEAGPKPLTSAQEQKLRATITKDYKTVNDSLAQMLNPVTGVVAAVNGVRKLSKSQKEWLVGKTNYLPTLTDAGQTADTRLSNLTGKVTQMGKVLASLGGAIGPMAVQEWNIVRGFIAELDTAKMSPKDLEDQLDIIEAAALGAAERISDAYNNQYVEEFARYPGRFELKGPPKTPVKKNPAESQIPRIKTDAQWNALKPGTLYIAPNGETKRKR
jgi:hypothetical protein